MAKSSGLVPRLSVYALLIGIFAVVVGLVAFRAEQNAQDERMRPIMDRHRARGHFVLADTKLDGQLPLWRNVIWGGAGLAIAGVFMAGFSTRRPRQAAAANTDNDTDAADDNADES